MKARITFYGFLLAMFMLSGLSYLHAGEPTEQLRAALDEGVEVLNRARGDGRKRKAEIVSRLREIVYPLFDFREMAKRSLGSHWRRLDSKRQEEFVSAFTELLENTYADKIDLYEGQKVLYTGESIDRNYAEVDTKVVGKKGESFSVNYKLHRADGRWRIYDVVVENISLVNNYRSQFQRVIANSSLEQLIERIKAKAS
ncbi:MAG: ABC transporter substrate-binding protein [Deltaproteobacteria bacterium]|nr:ABC transporter substrate-binding protein [Deltaproteobacteria bacterium]